MKLRNLFDEAESDGKRAVSPVIGVILMVAITVILAAVIGTFVLGLGDDIEQNVQAGVTVDQNPDQNTVDISWTAQGNADGIKIDESYVDGTTPDDNSTTSVGGTITAGGDGTDTISAGDTIAVVAFQGDVEDPERETVVRTIEVQSGIDTSSA